jgi:cytochrome oxidase Cu insertion factor (SCO1/SenC/PrrC family)
MSEAARRGLYIFLAALAVIIGGVVYEQLWLGDGATAPAVGGPFTLIDQNGTPRRDSDFRGKVMLVYFGYTYCPDACPATLQAISETLDILGDKAAMVQPLFISVDPARDTPEQLKSYAENFHPTLIALTGAPDQLQKVEQEYHVYVAKVPQSGSDDYLIDHSSIIYVMGADGRYRGQIPTGLPPKVMAATIQRFL